MDLSKFSDDNFSVKDWVNSVFRSQPDDSETYTTTLVARLQNYIQVVNKSLEEASQQTVANLPRVLRDVDTLKQETSFLCQQMKQVKKEIEAVEEKTSHSMRVLVHVDEVKNRVEQTCKALKEADNWSMLASAIEDIFKSGDMNAVAKQLACMKVSLQVLKNSPDYEDKLMHLEALKNRLETALSTSMVVACVSHNTEEAKNFYRIFKSIERTQDFINYYLKCHRGRVGNMWQQILEGPEVPHNGSSQQQFLMSEYYQLLLNAWHSESQWCASVFGREPSVEIALQLVYEVNVSSDQGGGGPSTLIKSCLDDCEYEKLQGVISMHEITKKFTADLQVAMSEVKMTSQVEELLVKISDAVWTPYTYYLLQYADFETEALMTSLSSISLSSSDIIDLVQVLDDSVDKVFAEAKNAIDRCDKATGFIGSGELKVSLEKYFNEYLERFSRELRTLAKKFKISNHNEDGEDWTLFQNCVRIITTCGKIIVSLRRFETTLNSSLLQVASKRDRLETEQWKSMPWEDYDYLRMATDESRERFFSTLEYVRENKPVFDDVTRTKVEELNQQAQKLTFEVAFAYVSKQLSTVSKQHYQEDADVRVFDVSPSECATRVGQYLMTLPQHLEAFAGSSEDGSGQLDCGLEVALAAGNLPFPPDKDLENSADRWLSSLIQATEHTYYQAVSHIDQVSVANAKQIVADLDYMNNVVDSLGMNVSVQLQNLRDLLNCKDADELKTVSREVSNNKLVDVVAKMRNMKLN